MKIKLYPHQQKLLETFPDSWGMWLDTGLGKTFLSLALIESRINLKQEIGLVICPKIVRENWRKHIKQQGLAPEDNLSTSGDKMGIIVRSKEDMVREWDALPKCNAVVYDEFHFALNPKQTTKGKKTENGVDKNGKLKFKYLNKKPSIAGAFRKYLSKHQPKCLWCATATPYRSSPWDLYMAWWIIRKKPPMGYKQFEHKFFIKIQIGRMQITKPKTDALTKEFITNSYKKIGTFLKKEDVFDMPPIIEEDVYFQPTVSQMDAVRDIDEMDFITVFTKTLQIMNGTLKGGEYDDDKFLTSDKYDWVMEYIKENNSNLFIVCRHSLEIERFQASLKTLNIKTYIISGQEKPDFDRLNEDEGRYVIIGQAQSLVGFDIMNIDTMIFYSVSFSFVDLQQTMGRITRGKNVEKKKYLKYYYLQVSNTVDEAIYKKVKDKKDFSIQLYDN